MTESRPAARRRPGRVPAATPEQIQQVALELFRQDGFAATTVDRIAEASGVGRTTVFRYFTNKSAILWWDFEANYERLAAELKQTTEPGLIDGILTALHVTLGSMPTSRDAMGQRRIGIDQLPALAAELAVMMMRWATRIAAHARAHGLPAPQADAIGYALLGATVAATRAWVVDTTPGRSLAEELDGLTQPLGQLMQAWVS
jgi:AcrR family transcriptional regulator